MQEAVSMARSNSDSSDEAGGRTRARRLFVVIALVLSGICQGGTTKADEPAAPTTQVTVREEAGVYRVAARFEVAQPASVARAVLTDYEQIPRFMPDVKTSIVRERFPDGVIVEQEAVAHMLMFSKRIHLLLEVHMDDHSVRFRDSSGRSFEQYEGAWTLVQHDRRTVITYELTARPCFDVPEFLLTRLLKRDSREMIERLRTEMDARSR
ncbi:MAG TPA: SRPBCC family protein [Vicinamibacterales bacterium]|nr:SRPBCC family protein [Vicinamibacterales bacterium]